MSAGPYRYRKIMVPVDEEHRYRAENVDTGEVLECSNIVPLLRRIAADPLHAWKIKGTPDDETNDNVPVPSDTYNMVYRVLNSWRRRDVKRGSVGTIRLRETEIVAICNELVEELEPRTRKESHARQHSD